MAKKMKLKTKKAAVKRLRMTKSGLLKKRNAGRQHILGKKTRFSAPNTAEYRLLDLINPPHHMIRIGPIQIRGRDAADDLRMFRVAGMNGFVIVSVGGHNDVAINEGNFSGHFYTAVARNAIFVEDRADVPRKINYINICFCCV